MDSPRIPKKTIRDYFSPTTTRENHRESDVQVQQHQTQDDGEEDDGSHERPAKKFRLTAENGRDIALRALSQEKTDKKVKSERTEENLLAVRKSNGRGAKLGLLPSLPLDVLLEIFSHLAPLDILRLSRTTKDLRRLLLHRSSSSVWRAALSSIPELPACPNDLSLPFYTNLVFDHHCQNCLATNVKKCDFILRVRYCNKCANTKLLPIHTFNGDSKLNHIIVMCVPFSKFNDRTDMYCSTADRDKIVADLALADGDPKATEDFVAQRRIEVNARREHARACKKWMESVMETRETELNEIRDARADAIRAELFDLGYSPELEFLDDIEEEICAIQPWPKIATFYNHKHVKVPKPFTQKLWASIKGEMIQYMAEASKLRQENLRCLLVQKRRSLVHAGYVVWRRLPENLIRYPAELPMPNPADVLEFESIDDDLIEAPASRELDIDRDIIPFLKRHLPAEIVEWRNVMTDALFYNVLETRMWREAKFTYYTFGFGWKERKRLLALAVVVFRCTRRYVHWRWEEKRLRDDVVFPAQTPDLERAIQRAAASEAHAPIMWFPQFVHHRCPSLDLTTFDEDRTKANRYLRVQKEFAYCRHAPWDRDVLVFDEKASRATRNILEVCGLDWRTTTAEELDERDPRLVCLKCSYGVRCDGQRKVRVWTWRDAVQHCLSAHYGDSLVTWESLSQEDAAEARMQDTLESFQRGFHVPTKQKRWRCVKCRDTTKDTGRMNWDALEEHFRQNPSHGDADKMDGEEGKLYYGAMDVQPREGPPVKMIPSATDPLAPWVPTKLAERRRNKYSFLMSMIGMPLSP